MPTSKRLSHSVSENGLQRCRSSGRGSRFSLVFLLFLFILAPLLFLAGRTVHAPASTDQKGALTLSNEQMLDWKEQPAVQQLKSILTKEIIDSIIASRDEFGPWSLDSFRRNHGSSSWKIYGLDSSINSNVTAEDEIKTTVGSQLQISLDTSENGTSFHVYPSKDKGDKDKSVEHELLDSPAKLARRQLRQKRRERRVKELIQQDNETLLKLENDAIERSKFVDSAILGKYSVWRRDNDNENSDSTIRLMRDQVIMAKVYSFIAKSKNNHKLYLELLNRLKESQRALGEANADGELPHNAPEKIKIMGQTLSKSREELYDCRAIAERFRLMLQSAEEQVRGLKKQSTFLSQLAAKTIPKGIHCLSMRLTIAYHLLHPEKREFPRSENLENANLFHYAIFSDNVLAASVVVNSTVMNAKEAEKHVFHLVTDKLNFGAMKMWFLLNPPGKATIHVENVDEFKWLNSSYCPVLRQLESAAMREYYFRADQHTSLSAGSSNLKYRNPKYLSMLNHLRFYLPQVYPKLDKILFLDDDIVVQKDLTRLWSINLKGNVNGAVETCGQSFHRFDKYLNFSNPHIARNFDPNACGWAYGMNIFDLKEWKKRDITGIYHKWQNMNEDRVLWKLGTLPPGLLTFYKLTYPLDKSWHVLGLGYNPSIDRSEMDNAAVIHYNGNMKPWLELAVTKYRAYWSKYIKVDHPDIRNCSLGH
ncbi:Polygalacturonate 4-alpha-galacturonosyltransferase [Platanthera zijinensis]|uniref:Polygalacturonate 4-alpha-galacturonosyltransferase n=1 Tax=Platanthera zijinensis TaxID=2320716 RepID=A0AAP0BXN2_9ASPA